MTLPLALSARPRRARGAQRRGLWINIARRRGSGLPVRGWRRIIWHLKQKFGNVRGHHQRISWRGGLVCGGRVSLALCVGKRNWGERRSEFTKSRCALPCLISAVHSDPAGRVISRDAGGQRTEKKATPRKTQARADGAWCAACAARRGSEEQRSLLWLAEQKRIKVRVAEEQEHLGRMRRRRVQLHICETLVAAGAIIECREQGTTWAWAVPKTGRGLSCGRSMPPAVEVRRQVEPAPRPPAAAARVSLGKLGIF